MQEDLSTGDELGLWEDAAESVLGESGLYSRLDELHSFIQVVEQGDYCEILGISRDYSREELLRGYSSRQLLLRVCDYFVKEGVISEELGHICRESVENAYCCLIDEDLGHCYVSMLRMLEGL